MNEYHKTPRQQIMGFLAQRPYTSRELAELAGISERQVEEHIPHIVKSLARDATRQFLLEPSSCRDCRFVFRGRTRITKPSRCPRCHSENISPPRYHIQHAPSSPADKAAS